MKTYISVGLLAVVLCCCKTNGQYPINYGNPYGTGYPYNYGNLGLGNPYGNMYGNTMYGNGLYGTGVTGNGLYGTGVTGNGLYGTGVYGNNMYGNGVGYPYGIYGNTGVGGLPTYGMGGVYGGTIPLFSEQFYSVISQVVSRHPMTFDDYNEGEYLSNEDRCEALADLAQFHMQRQNLWRIQDPNLAYNYYNTLRSIVTAHESNILNKQQLQCQRALFLILGSHGSSPLPYFGK